MWIRRCVLLCMLILTLCAGTAMADVAREVTGDAKFSVPYNNNTIRAHGHAGGCAEKSHRYYHHE